MKLEMLIARAKYYEKTQKEMAKKIGISESRFSDWKTGRVKPSAFEIYQMAELARLEPEQTFYDVMTEVDKDNADYWCARRESNPRPSASESVSLIRLICNFMLIFINKHRNIYIQPSLENRDSKNPMIKRTHQTAHGINTNITNGKILSFTCSI